MTCITKPSKDCRLALPCCNKLPNLTQPQVQVKLRVKPQHPTPTSPSASSDPVSLDLQPGPSAEASRNVSEAPQTLPAVPEPAAPQLDPTLMQGSLLSMLQDWEDEPVGHDNSVLQLESEAAGDMGQGAAELPLEPQPAGSRADPAADVQLESEDAGHQPRTADTGSEGHMPELGEDSQIQGEQLPSQDSDSGGGRSPDSHHSPSAERVSPPASPGSGSAERHTPESQQDADEPMLDSATDVQAAGHQDIVLPEGFVAAENGQGLGLKPASQSAERQSSEPAEHDEAVGKLARLLADEGGQSPQQGLAAPMEH